MSKKTKVDFTIGADPEFSCEKDGKLVVAEEVITNEPDDGQFGCDGNGVTFEIRPSADISPIKLVNNIHKVFVSATMQNPDFLNYKWISRSFHLGYPLGGHVHFGIHDNQYDHATALLFLDDYVGSISLLLENKLEGIRRRQDNYGRKSGYRTQSWGFEYRPMSSWLSSPAVSAGILCLSKMVMYECLNNPRFNFKCYTNETDFSNVDHDRLRSIFPKIWADIVNMELYQTYKPYVDVLYFLVLNKLTWYSKKDMKETWALVDFSKSLNKVIANIIWQRFNSEQ